MVVVVTSAIILAGCGGDSGSATEEPASSSATTSEPAAEPSTSTTAPADPPSNAPRGRVVKTAGSAYGPMLFDRSGQAIYLFDKEATAEPECYGACADAWPPVLTKGDPRASGAVRSALLGTTARKDGSRQVTYDGHPLYFYAHEDKHEVLCHNVSEFGGLWLVLTPAGPPAAA